MKKKFLNLYAGIGGNVELLDEDEFDITHVEQDPKIGEILRERKPNQKMIIGDAHDFLLQHFKEYDFIWSSPPCQSHTKMIRSGRNRKPTYPDFKLYEEIIFLEHNFTGLWCVENVVPYYKTLLPGTKIGRHLFWSNFPISIDFEAPEFKNFINRQNLVNKKELHEWLGIHYEKNIYYKDNHCPTQILRNAVHPRLGQYVVEQSKGVTNKKVGNSLQAQLFN